MRDILEEEERRKKTAFKEPVAANAPRRAYAETTNKVRRRRFDVYLL
jgi:PERQ amino acid-rich with GYF domain-containing protein